MPKTIRRYCLAGPSQYQLHTRVSASAMLVGCAGASLDIEIDDDPTLLSDLDYYMGRKGFVFQKTVPAASSGIVMQSENGRKWDLVVDNDGNVVAREIN